jgi:acyl-CoA synthetase (AMP-forming)/AMP-acid ligase II
MLLKRTSAETTVGMLTGPGGPFELKVRHFGGIACHWYGDRPAVLSALYGNARVYFDRVMMVDEARRLTYREALLQAGVLADRLRDRQLGRGSRVAIAMQNRFEWMIAFIAITAIGGVAILINSRGAAEEISTALANTRPLLLFADRRCAERLRQASAPPEIPIVLARDPDDPAIPGIASDFATEVSGWQKHSGLKCTPVEPEDIAIVMFTAGTTGTPKAVMLSHRSVMAGVANSAFSAALSIASAAGRAGQLAARMALKLVSRMQSTVLLIAPLFHVSGCQSTFLRALDSGSKLVVMRKWSPEAAIGVIASEKVQQIGMVPTMLWDLLRSPVFEPGKVKPLMVIGGGGAPFPANLRREAAKRMPKVIFAVGYGSTETNGPIATANGVEFLNKPDACGRVQPAVEMRLLREDGGEAAVGEEGEILVRCAAVMSGYLDRPEDTGSVLENGWLRTGDVGRFDSDGVLFIVDRKKHMVICGGENVYCAEVERAFSELPGVREVLAFGVADERLGESVAVVIVHDLDVVPSAEKLRDQVAKLLAPYKIPSAIYFRDRPMPRTATGKVDRRAVIESAASIA